MLVVLWFSWLALAAALVAGDSARVLKDTSTDGAWKPIRKFRSLDRAEELEPARSQVSGSPERSLPVEQPSRLASANSFQSPRVRRHSRYALGQHEARGYPQAQVNEHDDDDEPEAVEPAPASGRLDARESSAEGLEQRTRPAGEQAQAEYDEAAERAEQEAAEASEADAANKSALDEQQQAQREIIRAQAASEAKAIREQQEALMRQQRLQQQMLLRRHHELDIHQSQPRGRIEPAEHRKRARSNARSQVLSRRQSAASNGASDIQFSDQPDKQSHGESEAAATRAVPVPVPVGFGVASRSLGSEESGQLGWLQLPSSDGAALEELKKLPSNADLLSAAAGGHHSYGSHYGSLHGHQKDYYQ